jgi:hypothetical protein
MEQESVFRSLIFKALWGTRFPTRRSSVISPISHCILPRDGAPTAAGKRAGGLTEERCIIDEHSPKLPRRARGGRSEGRRSGDSAGHQTGSRKNIALAAPALP